MYTSIKIRDYKCFVKENDCQGFDEIKPINVIIGKNNSGKSKLLEALAGIVEGTQKSMPFEGIFIHLLTEDELIEFCKHFNDPFTFATHYYSNQTSWDVVGKYLLDQPAIYVLKNKQVSLDNIYPKLKNPHWNENDLLTMLRQFLPTNHFDGYRFLHLRAERDINKEAIQYEPQITDYKIEANATGICSLIARMLNDEQGHTAKLIGISGNEVNWKQYIENDFLSLLNEVVTPEITFNRIYTLTNAEGLHEIYLEEQGKGGIKLSDCGSGLKTIIATLTLLHIIPCLSGNYKNVFAFEELENNLHPSLERKLLKHIKTYSEKHSDSLIFLTTHSNVSIDLFGKYEKAQIVRVCNNGHSSSVEPVFSEYDKRVLLDDLGVKASDLLQSNCVIWVEGPSDRIYIKKWIELFGGNDLEEGLDYQFIYYGGALLSHYSATDKETDSLIKMLEINRNSYVVMDSDKRSPEDKWKNRVERITKELPEAHWVTAGKEIENYLPSAAVTHYLGSTINIELFDLFPEIYKRTKQVDNFDKVQFASSIIKDENYTKENLAKCLDLEEQISKLIAFIRKSNLHPC